MTDKKQGYQPEDTGILTTPPNCGSGVQPPNFLNNVLHHKAPFEIKEQCKRCFHFQICANVMKNQLFIREKMLKEENPKCEYFISAAEVERKDKQIRGLVSFRQFCEAEAIKEILEKITAAASRKTVDTLFGLCLYISVDSIENILKEYTGKDE